MKTPLVLAAFVVALSAQPTAQAGPVRSLGQARSAVISGSTSGITLLDFGRKPAAESAAAPAAAAPAPAAATANANAAERAPALSAPATAAAAPAPARSEAAAPTVAQRLGALFGNVAPPGGEPLNAAKRLDSPSLGITLPSASSR